MTLDTDACKGCINCIKRCPTEAIRVREGKAHIITERCIDCGECIRVCPNHAKQAVTDSLSMHRAVMTRRLPCRPPPCTGSLTTWTTWMIVLDGLSKHGL